MKKQHTTWMAALSVAGALMATPASAQTTQERLDHLLQQLAAQQQALEALSKEVERLKRAQAATPAPGKAMAEAPTVKSGNDKVRLTLKGQINRGVMVVDDGESSEVFHVDNDFSSTRFDLIAEAKPRKDLKIGGQIEMEIQSNASNKVTMTQNSTGTTTVAERIIDIYLDSKQYGRLTMGQGKMASDGTSETDLSGTGVIALSKVQELAADVRFRQYNATAAFGPTIDAVYTNMDGLAREDRIRYDTPKFHGLQVSASHADGGEFDVALRHSGNVDGVKTKAAIAYANSSSVDDRKQINGSASVLFPVGLSVTFAAGSQDPDAPAAGAGDPMFWWGKIGWQTKLFPDLGKTAFSIDYGQSMDFSAQGDAFESIGGAIVQSLDDWGTELYLSGRNYSLKQTAQSYHDVFAVISGARIKF
ncbi:MAG: porin [Alphaproteobacteria bacterium]|nr:porin [Alphaproteobacteria bacterium]